MNFQKIHIFTFLLGCLLMGTTLQAQGTLQFNQVITTSFTGTTSGVTTLGTITVPAGKVLKVESASFLTPIGGSPNFTSGNYAKIGSFFIWFYTGNAGIDKRFPIWLKAGTYNVIVNQFSGTAEVAISGIEFNVIP